MPPLIDLTGKRFGRLAVIGIAENNAGRIKWECRCDCGNMHVASGVHLKSGGTQSCGCFQRESLGNNRRTHGKTRTRVYAAFQHMRRRCESPNDGDYLDYGGRGIKICDRWATFENFLEDMGEPEKGYSLGRIDNNGNYEPDNCKWATADEQANNKRNSHLITWNGQTLNLTTWARMAGKDAAWLIKRLKRMPFVKAMAPLQP